MSGHSFSKPILKRLREAELPLALKLNNAHLYQIVQALIWVGEGQPISRLVDLLGVSSQTIYDWVKKFLSRGFSWLCGRHYQGRGRKSKLTPDQKAALYSIVKQGPEASGFSCGVWNTAMIADVIFLKFGVQYNLRYLSTLLKKMGLSYQKARFISHHHDEEAYEKARQTWLKTTWPKLLKQAQEQNAVILFGDEVSFAQWGSLSRTWAPRGEQPLVKTTGIRKGLKMFGTIEFQSGDFQYRESLYYSLTPKSFKALKLEGLSKELLAALKGLKNETYTTQAKFLAALEASLDAQSLARYQTALLAHAQTAGKFNSETYIEFLEQLLNHYSCPIILVEDGVSYHHSVQANTFKAQHADRLTTEPLPTFSPDFNPIEKLWKNTKRDATHLKYFKTFEELRASVIHAFKSYLHDASQVLCVMKKLRTAAGLVIA